MLTSFSVTLVTVGQKRGQAAALRDPRVTTPKGEAGLDHGGQGGSVRHAPRCEDRLSKPSTPLPAAAATPGRDSLGLHAVAETGPLPLTSPKGCGTIPAHASGISWNASSGKPPTLPGTPAHRCDTTCLCTDQRNSRARAAVLGGVGC